MTQISIVVLTYKRDGAIENTISRIQSVMGSDIPYKFILVDNNTDLVNRAHLLCGFENACYIREDYNMGVAAGRNRAMREIEGDVVIFLDDDALLEVDADFARKILADFSVDPRLGVVAFRSFVGHDRIEDPKEFPHTNKKIDHNTDFETFRFIGVGHAIRVAHLREVGNYCAAFFYGMEEFDLAYRFIKAGYRIEYKPEYCVQHMKEESGRLVPGQVLRRMYANKLAVAWMHLPMRYFISCAAAWFLKTSKDARSLITPIGAIGDFIAMASHGKLLKRAPSDALVRRIQQLGGDAWR